MNQTANISQKLRTAVPLSIGNVFDKGYRHGFNAQEKDEGSEGMGGGGSTYDYGFRIYNPSLGKFLSVDPLSSSYPWFTPYQFAGNMPIWAVDLDGLEEYFVNLKDVIIRPPLNTKWADQVLDDIAKQEGESNKQFDDRKQKETHFKNSD